MNYPKTTINKKLTNNLFLLTLLFLTIVISSPSFADDNNSVNSSLTNLVTVGDPGNWSDSQGIGAVATPYQIGKYEVTAVQYTAFLNAVAWKEDLHGLYHSEMSSDETVACITRTTNADGTYSYDVIPNRENFPITYVSLNDAERYCNWLENGAPTSEQAYDFLKTSTEMGAYNFSMDANGNEIVESNINALVHIPSQDEWVKAAYYNGHGTNADYSLYPTRNNTAPTDGTTATQLANEANYNNEHSARLPVITPVNCFSNTMSSYQVCDMAGNVAEWTTTPLSNNPSLVIVRGGSWKSSYSWWGFNDLMRTAPPKGDEPSVGTNFIGFRIAMAIPLTPPVLNRTTPSDGTNDFGIVKGYPSSIFKLTADEKESLLSLVLLWSAISGTTTIMITCEIAMDYFVLGMDWEAICATFPSTRLSMIPVHIFCGGVITDSFLNLLNKYVRSVL